MYTTPADDMIVVDELSRSSDFVAYIAACSPGSYHERLAYFLSTTDLPK